MKKVLSVILATSMLLAMLASCSGDAGSTTTVENTVREVETVTVEEVEASGVPVGIQEGTEIVVRANLEVSGLLAGQISGGQILYTNVYDTLFYAPYGDYENLTGLVAESWEISDDGLQWVIQIHEGIKFVSGNTMDAPTIVRAFEYSKTWQPAYFTTISSIEATGDYELTFTFSAPFADFMQSFSLGHVGIVDPNIVDEYGETIEAGLAGASSGPYYIAEYKTGDYTTLKANPDYWNEERTAHIETIVWKYIADDNTAASALIAGDISFAEFTGIDIVNSLAGNDFDIVLGRAETLPLWFNCTGSEEALQNVNVRKALTMMVDFEEANEAAYGGDGWVQNSAFIDNMTNYFDDGYVYDPEQGVELLAAEGYAPEDIELYAVTATTRKALHENIQAQLARVGVVFTFDTYDTATAGSLAREGNWELYAFHSGFNDVLRINGIYNLLAETGTDPVFNTDRDESMSPIWDAVIAAKLAASYEEQTDRIEDLAVILADEYAYLGCLRTPKWEVFAPEVKNIVFENAYYLWQMYYAYLEV